jgi:hypothetical protein
VLNLPLQACSHIDNLHDQPSTGTVLRRHRHGTSQGGAWLLR